MKKPVIILGAMALIAICCGQEKQTESDNNMVMKQNNKETHNVFKDYIPVKQLNIKEFNAKRNSSNCYFIDDNGIAVEQTVSTKFPSGEVTDYIENRKFSNSGYEFYSEYDASGKLVKTLVSFYGMETGFMCFYNLLGEIIKKEDLDIHYKFSIDGLIDKMKAEYKVDITDTRICFNVVRGIYEKHNDIPLYSVYLYGVPVRSQLICYVIDGNTEKTLFTTTRYLNEKRESITDEYFNSLKK